MQRKFVNYTFCGRGETVEEAARAFFKSMHDILQGTSNREAVIAREPKMEAITDRITGKPLYELTMVLSVSNSKAKISNEDIMGESGRDRRPKK